eukprot:Skav210389  [mRNA]  locus=scaffold1526:354096:357644:+ [translate_table: standard]
MVDDGVKPHDINQMRPATRGAESAYAMIQRVLQHLTARSRPEKHGGTPESGKMRLRRFLLRYFPPGTLSGLGVSVDGLHRLTTRLSTNVPTAQPSTAKRRIILEYHARNGDLETKCIDLLDLTPATEVEALVKKLVREEPLMSCESTKDARRTHNVGPVPGGHLAKDVSRPESARSVRAMLRFRGFIRFNRPKSQASVRDGVLIPTLDPNFSGTLDIDSTGSPPRIFKLIEKGTDSGAQRFGLFKILRGHQLPLTSCLFNKSGSKIITGQGIQARVVAIMAAE